MKRKMKKKLTGLIVLAMLLCSLALPVYADEQITVTVDGVSVQFVQPPLVEHSVVLTHLRPVVELMDGEIAWNQDTRTAMISFDQIIMEIRAGSHDMVVYDGISEQPEVKRLTVAPRILNDNMFVPIDEVAEALGFYAARAGTSIHTISPVIIGLIEDTGWVAEGILTKIGVIYELGFGVEQCYEQALYWYRKGVEQGDNCSILFLGVMYEFGEGVEQDYDQAVYWYRKAAEQGFACAQFSLGTMYERGLGVEQDYEQAIYWYRNAAEQGHEWAQYYLGYSYEFGEGIEQDYAQAVYWHRKAAEQGNVLAQRSLGNLYRDGNGVEVDFERAAYWFRLAAEQEDAEAAHLLGEMYKNGIGVGQSDEQAAYWLNKAIEWGYTG